MAKTKREQCNSNKKAGRAYQSYVARRLGGKSVGTIELQDIEHPIWSIEVKKRKAFSGKKFMEQAVRNAPENKTPLVVVHVTNDNHDNDLVMMQMIDFEDWYVAKTEEED